MEARQKFNHNGGEVHAERGKTFAVLTWKEQIGGASINIFSSQRFWEAVDYQSDTARKGYLLSLLRDKQNQKSIMEKLCLQNDEVIDLLISRLLMLEE